MSRGSGVRITRWDSNMRVLKQLSIPLLPRRSIGPREPLLPYGRLRGSARHRVKSRRSWAGVSVLTVFSLFMGCDREESGLLVPRTTLELATSERPELATSGVRTGAPGADALGSSGTQQPTIGSAATPQAHVEVAGAGDLAGSHACSVLGMVSARPRSASGFDIKRKDVSSVINALREHAQSGSKSQLLAPATTKDGRPGLRMIGVGLQSECGIRSEDVIVAINGIPVADRVVLAENREKLTAASELALELERNGQKRLITYFVSE